MSYLVLEDSPNDVWRPERVAEQALGALGCAFLSDLEVCGSGYLFHRGRFVREFVNISDVALQWLGQPDFYDNPLTNPRTNRVVIEEPALVIFGPGSSVYGHWLLDFMPRIAVARQLLGSGLDNFVIPLPSDTPPWVESMISTFSAIDPSRIRYYSQHDDMVLCRRACLPTYAHSGKSGDYAPHDFMRSFYNQFGNPGAPRKKRRICISRRSQERRTAGVWRIFEGRQTLERLAEARGFEIVQPEELEFSEQIELFRSADCILGEHGSGMHAAVFADPGTVVATIGAWNRHQLNISAAFEQKSICLKRHTVLQAWETPPFRFSVTDEDLEQLLDHVDAIQGGGPAAFRDWI